MTPEQRESIYALAAMFFDGSEDITSAFYAIQAAIEERRLAAGTTPSDWLGHHRHYKPSPSCHLCKGVS